MVSKFRRRRRLYHTALWVVNTPLWVYTNISGFAIIHSLTEMELKMWKRFWNILARFLPLWVLAYLVSAIILVDLLSA